MAKTIKPITIFTADAAEAAALAAANKNSRAMATGIGTLVMHKLIAQHGAGEFETLYAPIAFRGQWRTPIGGETYYTDAAQPLRALSR